MLSAPPPPCRPPRPPCPGSPRPLESAPSAALQRSLSNEAGLIAPRRRRMGRTLNHQPGPTFLKPLNVAARVSLSSYCRPRKGARIFFADACNSPILDCVSTPYLITVSTTTSSRFLIDCLSNLDSSVFWSSLLLQFLPTNWRRFAVRRHE